MQPQPDFTKEIIERLDRLEGKIEELLRQRTVKEFYDVEEAATILGRAPFTVREWCRHGRIHATKKTSGRGKHQAWVVSHEEILRIQREGLLPAQIVSTRIE